MNNPKPNKTTAGKKSPPLPKCPGCGMVKNEWPGEGYAEGGQIYCCQGCAEGTGCTCKKLAHGFSREGQQATKAAPRPGKQRSGAPAPQGELSGERDDRGTEEGIDEAGQSSVYQPVSRQNPGPRERPKDATPPQFVKKKRAK